MPRNNACLVGPPGVGKTAVVEGRRISFLFPVGALFNRLLPKRAVILMSKSASHPLSWDIPAFQFVKSWQGLAIRIAEGKACRFADF